MDDGSRDPLDGVESTRPQAEAPREPSGGAGAAAGPSPAVLRKLGERFHLRGVLGRGAAGVVYEARDPETGRGIALKVVAAGTLDARRRERFRREGEITASLDHPGIVRIHGAGEVDGVPYLAYELVAERRTLRDVLPGVPLRRRVELLRDAGAALGAAHAAGVVHRDVKPENVLVTGEGRVRVADFGLAAAQGLAGLTVTGAMLGTPSFMAPEQYEGRREIVGPATDVWGLGVILYAALTGALPFEGGSLLELGSAIQRADPTAPRALDPSIPADLEAVALEALRREPAERYADGAAFAADVDAWLAGTPVAASRWSAVLRRARRRRTSLLVAAGLAAAGLLLGGLAWTLPAPAPRPPAPDERPPTLRLEAPVTTAVTAWDTPFAVEGVLAGEDEAGRIIVGRRRVRAEPGRPFRVSLELEPGENEVTVRAVDAAGNEAPPVRLAVTYRPAPGWYAELPAERRPPLPLREGLEFGERPAEYENQRDGSVLVWVPAGTFVMGADAPSRGADPEGPPHRVTLTEGFFIGKHEVRRGNYAHFCRATDRELPPAVGDAGRDHPVVGVSWAQARAYCDWAGLRLPTEAEWELAARGRDGRTYPWGDEPPGPRRANLGGDDLYERTSPVGSFPRGASPYGCLDMVGNVWEWVADRYAPYDAAPAVDPTGPETSGRSPAEPELGEWRVHRGGSWNSTHASRATARARGGEHYNNSSLGFRVARSP